MTNFISFHGTQTKALSGSDSLKIVANFVASAMRGNSQRRGKMITQEMRSFITKDNDDNIVVSYLGFCDLLGRRATFNDVLLREVSPRSALRNINSLRHIGLDVFEMSWARHGQGDVGLVITNKFKHNDELVPSFFRDTVNPPTMEQIFADGARIGERAAA